jgi:hypothetical protein
MARGVNNSRLTTMTYPNGKVLNDNYSTGLNDSINRLSSLSDSSRTLESYSYLGLSTVVVRAQLNSTLTYKSLNGGTGDAGDQYIGLDRFGRVVDQRWIKTSNGTATDRFQMGYDRDSNVLWRDNLDSSNQRKRRVPLAACPPVRLTRTNREVKQAVEGQDPPAVPDNDNVSNWTISIRRQNCISLGQPDFDENSPARSKPPLATSNCDRNLDLPANNERIASPVIRERSIPPRADPD